MKQISMLFGWLISFGFFIILAKHSMGFKIMWIIGAIILVVAVLSTKNFNFK